MQFHSQLLSCYKQAKKQELLKLNELKDKGILSVDELENRKWTHRTDKITSLVVAKTLRLFRQLCVVAGRYRLEGVYL